MGVSVCALAYVCREGGNSRDSTLSREDEDFPVVMRSMSISPVRGSVAADCVATCVSHGAALCMRACVRALLLFCVRLHARARECGRSLSSRQVTLINRSASATSCRSTA